MFEKAPSFQVDTAFVLSKSSKISICTKVEELKFVIFPNPPENLTSLPTSVETKTAADAFKFIAVPDVDAGVNVVDVVLVSR